MERFEEFLRERKYLKNVSDKTLVYYRCAFRSWDVHSQGDCKAWKVNNAKGWAFGDPDQYKQLLQLRTSNV
jgi:hypothetical protein